MKKVILIPILFLGILFSGFFSLVEVYSNEIDSVAVGEKVTSIRTVTNEEIRFWADSSGEATLYHGFVERVFDDGTRDSIPLSKIANAYRNEFRPGITIATIVLVSIGLLIYIFWDYSLSG
jgi:hypothetical protein